MSSFSKPSASDSEHRAATAARSAAVSARKSRNSKRSGPRCGGQTDPVRVARQLADMADMRVQGAEKRVLRGIGQGADGQKREYMRQAHSGLTVLAIVVVK